MSFFLKVVVYLTALEEETYFVYYPERLQTAVDNWFALFPRVIPYYAVKCNPAPFILRDLFKAGIRNFDCASAAEIELILKEFTSVSGGDLIYAQPCKFPQHLMVAKNNNVGLCTFDCEYELHKIAKIHPLCNVVMRIAIDDSTSLIPFSKKFGVPTWEEQSYLLQKCKDLNLTFAGVSFHVGSGCTTTAPFIEAINRADEIFALALATTPNTKPYILDIGGGFNAKHTTKEFAMIINNRLDQFIQKYPHSKLIAEPGRFLVEKCMDLYVSVTTVKKYTNKDGTNKISLYINNGVYQDLNPVMFDHYTPPLEILGFTKIPYDSPPNDVRITVFGDTCDSADTIGVYNVSTEQADQIIELFNHNTVRLIYRDMGAYSLGIGTAFNGYPTASVRTNKI